VARRPKTAMMEAVNCILADWVGLLESIGGCCVIVIVVVDEEESKKRVGESPFISRNALN